MELERKMVSKGMPELEASPSNTHDKVMVAVTQDPNLDPHSHLLATKDREMNKEEAELKTSPISQHNTAMDPPQLANKIQEESKYEVRPESNPGVSEEVPAMLPKDLTGKHDQLGTSLNQQCDKLKDLQEKVAGLAQIQLQQIGNTY